MKNKNKFTLKALRINMGWTQEEAAKRYKISVDTLKNYETYKTFPDVPTIERILEETGMNYDDIIFLPHNYVKTV